MRVNQHHLTRHVVQDVCGRICLTIEVYQLPKKNSSTKVSLRKWDYRRFGAMLQQHLSGWSHRGDAFACEQLLYVKQVS